MSGIMLNEMGNKDNASWLSISLRCEFNRARRGQEQHSTEHSWHLEQGHRPRPLLPTLRRICCTSGQALLAFLSLSPSLPSKFPAIPSEAKGKKTKHLPELWICCSYRITEIILMAL